MTYRHHWGEDRVYFHDDQGRLRSLSAGWTDIGPDDPFAVVSAGRAIFHTAGLLELAALLDALQEDPADG